MYFINAIKQAHICFRLAEFVQSIKFVIELKTST
jgi:hypothetical protein